MTKNEYIVQCPRCGAEFPEQEKFCPHCDTPNRKMICRSCGAQINASERVCKVCGAKNRRKTGSSRNFILIGVTVLAALGILFFPKQSKQADQPPAQAQEAVSQTPETPPNSPSRRMHLNNLRNPSTWKSTPGRCSAAGQSKSQFRPTT